MHKRVLGESYSFWLVYLGLCAVTTIVAPDFPGLPPWPLHLEGVAWTLIRLPAFCGIFVISRWVERALQRRYGR